MKAVDYNSLIGDLFRTRYMEVPNSTYLYRLSGPRYDGTLLLLARLLKRVQACTLQEHQDLREGLNLLEVYTYKLTLNPNMDYKRLLLKVLLEMYVRNYQNIVSFYLKPALYELYLLFGTVKTVSYENTVQPAWSYNPVDYQELYRVEDAPLVKALMAAGRLDQLHEEFAYQTHRGSADKTAFMKMEFRLLKKVYLLLKRVPVTRPVLDQIRPVLDGLVSLKARVYSSRVYRLCGVEYHHRSCLVRPETHNYDDYIHRRSTA